MSRARIVSWIHRWWTRECGGREVLWLALPLVISTSTWTVIYFTDRLFLLWYDPDALAAALPAGLVSFSVIAFFLGVASYVNTFVAQYFGAGRSDRIGLAVWQGAILGIACTPLVLATIPLAPTLFDLAGHSPRVRELEVTYYGPLAYGASALVISGALSAFFTGQGRVRTVMIVDSLAAVTNVGLDYAWIFGHFGFPAAGIEGAGWATVVANWFRVLVYLALMLRAAERQRYQTLAGCRFDGPLMRRLIRFGTPNGLQFVFEVGAVTMFLLLVGRIGSLELTATNLTFNVNSLAFMPIWGFGIATSTLVGQKLGENRPDLAARSTWTTFILASLYIGSFAILYLTVPELLLTGHEVQANPQEFARVRQVTVVLLRFAAAFAILDAMNVIFVSAIKGAGDTRFALWTMIVLTPVPVVPTWIGMQYFGLGLYWAWLGLTLWVWLLGVVFFARFMQGKWRSMRVIEQHYVPGVHEAPIEPLPAVAGETL